ncbi:MAG: Trk system potassium transporter TrkA, partial [Firmicutes bacterium]|nr:Trk system potassium transporter TrkA [Candidatus Caballimonas caccae]
MYNNMGMKSVVVGVGKAGLTIVENLIKENHDVTVIDVDAKKIENLLNKYDIQGAVGTGAEHDVMESCGVAETDFFIACTSHDDFNILVCILAKKLGAKKTIARVRDPRYFREIENLKKDLGIDMIFNPEYRTALEIAKTFRFPSARSLESFASGNANMVEYLIDSDDDAIIGKTVREIINDLNVKVLFGMVVRGNDVFIPDGDFIINEGDYIHVIGAESDIIAFTRKLHVYKQSPKSVVVIGGGTVSYYLSEKLISSGIDVKIIEKDEKKCEELSNALPDITVLCGDGTDAEVLDEEGIKDAGACVAITGSDESNVIVSLYALNKGVKKVISVVDEPTVNSMVDKIGLDTIVSPRNVIANYVIRFVRAHKFNESTGMKRLYMLEDGADAIEFMIKDTFKKIGVPLKEMRLKKNVIIGAVIREGKFLLPAGDTTLELGDRVVIVTKKSM